MRVGGTEALFFIVFMAIALVAFAVWIWALVDAITVPDDSMYRSGTKLIWVLVIVFTHLIGAVAYFALGRPRPSERGRRSRRAPPRPPPG